MAPLRADYYSFVRQVVDGVITKDKFYFSRPAKLSFSWSRIAHSRRNSASTELPYSSADIAHRGRWRSCRRQEETLWFRRSSIHISLASLPRVLSRSLGPRARARATSVLPRSRRRADSSPG